MRTFSLKKFGILLKTHIREEMNLWFNLLSPYLWIFFTCVTYHYIFKAALLGRTIPLGNYRISFPLFLISGLALARLILFSLRLFENTLARLKQFGLMETVLVSPTSLWEFLGVHALWKGLLIATEILAVLWIAGLLIGTPFPAFLKLSIAVSILLLILAYTGLGMAVSGFLLLTRRGAFLFPLLNQISIAFGGVFFPTDLLPKELHPGVHLLPITPALENIRLSLLQAPLRELMPRYALLTLFAVIFFSLGLIMLQAGIIWARKNGRL